VNSFNRPRRCRGSSRRVQCPDGLAAEGDWQVRAAPGQVVLKGLGFTTTDLQAATNPALDSKQNILSQVVPTYQQ
jgi:hypothetical protein